MAAVPDYEVRIGSYTLRHVQSLSLRLSMMELADSFSITTADRLSLSAPERVEIRVDGVLRLVGEWQTLTEDDAVGKADLVIGGYSSAQRLVKSSLLVDRRIYIDKTLEQIVRAVVEPYDLVVDVSESARAIASEPIGSVKVKPSQTAHAFLAELCKRQGCILVSGAASVSSSRQAKASVLITRVAARSSPVPVVASTPMVASFSRSVDFGQVHSQYLVSRRGKGVLDEDGTLKGLDGVAYDERMLYSPLIVQAQKGGISQAELNRQAEHEMRKRAAEAERVNVTFKSWSPDLSSTLWWPNTLHRVVNPARGYDETLMLVSADLGRDTSGGALARLDFMAPDAYAVLDQRKITKGGRGGYRVNKEWLAQHAQLVTEIDTVNDQVDFDESKLDLIWKPEDPDE